MTALTALWALIPTKDKLYALLIAVLVLLFWIFVRHERAVGRNAAVAVQAAAAADQAKRAAVKTAVGSTNSTHAEVRYVSTINAVIPDSPHLLVLDGTAAAAACAVSVSDGATDGTPAAESSVEHPRDVGPALDKIGRDSDAQVTYLQDILRSCITIGACKLQQ
jgi:hypothetical protein